MSREQSTISATDQKLLKAIADLPAVAEPPEALDQAILQAARQATRKPLIRQLRPWLSVAAAVFVVFFAGNLLMHDRAGESARSEQGFQPVILHGPEEPTAPPAADSQLAPQATGAASPGESVTESRQDNAPARAAAPKILPKAAQAGPAQSAPEPEAPAEQPELGRSRPQAFPADAAAPSERRLMPSEPKPLADRAVIMSDEAAADDAGLIAERSKDGYAADNVPAIASPASPVQTGPSSSASSAAGAGIVQGADRRRLPAAPGAHRESDQSSPESWFERLRALQQSGHRAEARALYDQFRVQYPDAHIPDDLAWLEAQTR